VSRLVEEIHASPVSLVLAVTGGGSDAIAQLLQIPGASNTLLEAVIPYHPSSLAQYLQMVPDSFCDLATARSMAMIAFLRAVALSPDKNPEDLAGVSCTASLATERQKKGEHRLHIAVQTCQQSVALSLRLQKGERSRVEEETVTKTLLLNEIASLCGVEKRLPLSLLEGEETERYQTLAKPLWRELVLGDIDTACMPQLDSPPPKTLFPGAFNPLHKGHELMAKIAADMTGSATELEISTINVDKSPLDYAEMDKRAQRVTSKFNLWFTRAATFTEKASLFPGVTFVVGTDTLKRIAAPIYYGGDDTDRDRGIQSIRDQGCHFLVFGRMDGMTFESLQDLSLPDSLMEICREVPENRFRMDISSTELRNQPE